MTDIVARLRKARAPYAESKIVAEARIHNACFEAEEEITRLRAGLVRAIDFLSALAPRTQTGSIRARKIEAEIKRAEVALTAGSQDD